MDENYWIPEAMIRTGGGFVSRLGELYRKGDLDDQRKLRNAFPEYWKDYGFRALANWKKWSEED
jgi:hypothetical protein